MKIAILPGDGVGREVTVEAVKVLECVSELFGFNVEISEHEIGGAAIKSSGKPLPKETVEACLEADAVLLGAVGTPEFENLVPEKRPEKGLLDLRKHLGGFANLRPAVSLSALIDSSPLRSEIFSGTDLLIVRELLGGVYFGEPRGFSDDGRLGYNTLVYSEEEVARVAKIAFEAAERRGKKVTSVDKANVLESSRLWRQTVTEVAAKYPSVEIEHLYIDACAMHLVTDPRRFDVILTGNLFGDILSDEAAVLTGSLGMLASATIGGMVDLYEPVHGSAPDIAGRKIANPLGAISCVAMCLRHTFKNEDAALAIERSIEQVLENGVRTRDLKRSEGETEVSTTEMGDLVSRAVTEGEEMSKAFWAV